MFAVNTHSNPFAAENGVASPSTRAYLHSQPSLTSLLLPVMPSRHCTAFARKFAENRCGLLETIDSPLRQSTLAASTGLPQSPVCPPPLSAPSPPVNLGDKLQTTRLSRLEDTNLKKKIISGVANFRRGKFLGKMSSPQPRLFFNNDLSCVVGITAKQKRTVMRPNM